MGRRLVQTLTLGEILLMRFKINSVTALVVTRTEASQANPNLLHEKEQAAPYTIFTMC